MSDPAQMFSPILQQLTQGDSIKDGTSNTVFFSERYGSPDGEYVLTAVSHPEASVPETGDEILIGFEFGDVNGDSRDVDTFDCSEFTQWTSGGGIPTLNTETRIFDHDGYWY